MCEHVILKMSRLENLISSQIKLKYKLQVKENCHAYKEIAFPSETH